MSTAVNLQDDNTCLHNTGPDYAIVSTGNGIRQRGANLDNEETPRYFIRPFKEGAGTLSSLQAFINEVTWLFHQQKAQQTLVLIAVNLMATFLLLSWCHTTQSMALMAYTYLSWFSFLSLITCLVCVWAENQRATYRFMFGYIRCEALAVFSSVMLSLLGALIIVKECVERLLEPETVHTVMLSMGGIVGLILHLGMTTLAQNPALKQVLRASQSSFLQEHVADMCQSLCSYVPALTRILLPRVDPVVLISIAGFLAIIGDSLILQIYNYQAADSVAALIIAVLTIATMFPLCVCSASILLQTTPASIFAQLDKCLREALTLDGVLEFRHENFWTLGVENPMYRVSETNNDPTGYILTGSLHVRIRRDANEQMVLTHIRERLSPLVPLLTVQVFKDDWTRSSTTLQLLKDSARALATSPSHSPHYVNVTYPHVYAPTKSSTGSSFSPQVYFPAFSRSVVSEGNAASNLPSSNISGRPTTKNFTEGNAIENRTTVNFMDDDISISEPMLYGNSESELYRNSTGWKTERSRENKISLQNWTPGMKSSIGRDMHSQKPSPYYVNVDFCGRPNMLQTTTGAGSKHCNNDLNHGPR